MNHAEEPRLTQGSTLGQANSSPVGPLDEATLAMTDPSPSLTRDDASSSVARSSGLASASDASLVAGICGRDEGALAEVYRRYAGAVFGLARRVLKDATLAEEVVQEIFLRFQDS